MTIEHSIIADPNIHEPKGVATAGLNKTYVANGAGSGVWESPKLVGQASATAGEVAVSDGAGSVVWQAGTLAGTVSQGVYDYNDLTTATTPISLAVSSTPGGATEITNDAAGPFTNVTYALEGLDNVWIPSTHRFDWKENGQLALGDTVSIRFDVEFTTAANDTDVFLWLELGTGGTPYHLPIISGTGKKSAATHTALVWTGLYMGDTNTLNNLGRVLASADKAGCTLKVNGWFVKVLHTNT